MQTPWYKSKTKWGGLLVGVGMIVGGVGHYLVGDVSGELVVSEILAGVGVILAVFGIRDALK